MLIFLKEHVKVTLVPIVERGEVLSKVAKLRRFKGLTQTEVAKILGVSLQWYWQKETGKKPFSDKEKMILMELFREDFPELSFEEIFFSQIVPKVEKGVK